MTSSYLGGSPSPGTSLPRTCHLYKRYTNYCSPLFAGLWEGARLIGPHQGVISVLSRTLSAIAHILVIGVPAVGTLTYYRWHDSISSEMVLQTRQTIYVPLWSKALMWQQSECYSAISVSPNRHYVCWRKWSSSSDCFSRNGYILVDVLGLVTMP
jgi:hypothetical protein